MELRGRAGVERGTIRCKVILTFKGERRPSSVSQWLLIRLLLETTKPQSAGPWTLSQIYLVGIPIDFKGDMIENALNEWGMPVSRDFEKEDKLDAFHFKHKYVRFKYSGAEAEG